MKIFLFNQVDVEKLFIVMSEMDVLGAPLVYYVSHEGYNFALFGSHRLTAAYLKGIKPFFAEIPYDETLGDMSLRQFAEHWGCYDENMLDGNCDFPICPPMRDITTPIALFEDNYRPYLDFT